MILKDSFFELISMSSSEESLRGKVRLNPSHHIFLSHFPGSPVTPGVCLIQIGTEIIEHVLSLELCLKSVQNIKFRKTIVPGIDGIEPEFVITKIRKDGNELKASISIECESVHYVKMSVTYTIENEVR